MEEKSDHEQISQQQYKKKKFRQTAKYETKYPRKFIVTSKSFSMIQNMNCEEREQTS